MGKIHPFSLAALFCLALAGQGSRWEVPDAGAGDPPIDTGIDGADERAGGAPILFAENRGQCAPEVLFQARIPGLIGSVLSDGFLLEMTGGEEVSSLRVRFVGAASTARAEGLEPRAARAHFLLGAEPAAWTRDVATFARVRVRGLYPCVDLELHENEGRIEYDLLLARGADPEAIALALEGAGTEIDGAGRLVARSGARTLIQLAPLAWQVTPDGARRALECSWRALGPGRFAFELAGHDRSLPTVVDPVLVYSTYVGGSNADAARGVFVDELGEVYVTGWARSSDFPLSPGALDSSRHGQEGVVFKLDASGRELRYATYFGGRGDDEGAAIAVDARGQAWVVGTTDSPDFPAAREPSTHASSGGTEAFALRLSADGSSILNGTLLGGAGDDSACGLALSREGGITLVGTTRSRDFPVSFRAFAREPRGGQDVFVTRLDARGEGLVYSTRLGGSEDDEGCGIAVDGEGAAYVTGRTHSRDFPTTLGALDREHCSLDGFAAKFSSGGVTLVYSTYLGGRGADQGTAITVDEGHRAVIVGWTESQDFPLTAGGPGGRRDGFAVRLSETGNALQFATRLGGSGMDECLGVALDARNSPWIVGRTGSGDFPRSEDALLASLGGGADAFLVGLDPARGGVVHASVLGGQGGDELCAVHADPSGAGLVLAGWADGIAPEERGTLSGKHRGSSDALVIRFDPRRPAARLAHRTTAASSRAEASGE